MDIDTDIEQATTVPRRAAATRERVGAGAWLATLVFFPAQAVAQAATTTRYSVVDHYVSDLGAVHCGPVDLGRYHNDICSPLHLAMNLGFIATGLAIIVGAALLYPSWPAGRARIWGSALLAAGGIGKVVAGLSPEDVAPLAHLAGGFLSMPLATAGVFVLSRAMWRPRRGMAVVGLVCGTTSVTGLVLAGFAAQGAGIGVGATERLAAYPTVTWLGIVGASLLVDRFPASIRRSPATTLTVIGTALVSIPALFSPAVVDALQQNPPAFGRGEWWRLVTPILIQGYGIGQFVFNLLGVVLVGYAVESRLGTLRWAAVYLVAGVGSVVATSLLYPHTTDSGCSAAVAGLVGAIVVGLAARAPLPPRLPLMYSVFFLVYLCALALGGPAAGAAAGMLTIPAFLAARRLVDPQLLRFGCLAVALITTAVMLALGDVHGIGVAIGIAVTVALRRRP
ncbi:rhomboid family intramembrane serine protease [Tsukamurella sp. 8F]|uniref:rhomboid family intramembrane serine protease n=1 Tax=unclassified Tsukamurella TaxID=2633480 RepID=UPI0023B88D31|nr:MULTISPECIES: rhomboid family intramembrane serine protease [unclassified Tsukamurella]MDF0531235.1 rhomboid family intramembrane serine protease [Tsukamurella sp. 8J]MDF0588504.1 rhomboid family intramembrane serine protease [Tsukamurella sp. 8F]